MLIIECYPLLTNSHIVFLSFNCQRLAESGPPRHWMAANSETGDAEMLAVRETGGDTHGVGGNSNGRRKQPQLAFLLLQLVA